MLFSQPLPFMAVGRLGGGPKQLFQNTGGGLWEGKEEGPLGAISELQQPLQPPPLLPKPPHPKPYYHFLNDNCNAISQKWFLSFLYLLLPCPGSYGPFSICRFLFFTHSGSFPCAWERKAGEAALTLASFSSFIIFSFRCHSSALCL